MDDAPDPPPYTKYRARPKLLQRDEDPSPRPVEPRPYGEVHQAGSGPRRRLPGLPGRGGRAGRTARRWTIWRVLRWALTAVVAWVALSVVVFLASALIHSDDVGADLGGGGPMPFRPSTILVLGSDARPEGSKEPGAQGMTSRADSILLMRMGGGHNAKLSIPRDTVVDIPGRGRNKINAAYAFGGTALMVDTIEQAFGLDVNHVMTVDFANFPGLIDAMGGVRYKGGCVVSRINGGFANGGYTLRLRAGEQTIDGRQALALARTRKNLCNPREDDLTRATRQQKILSAMKSRIASPTGFVRMPLIAWEAPKALRSDMNGFTQLGMAAALMTSGTAKTRVLKPTGAETLPDGGAGLVVSDARKQAAVRRFLRE